MATATNKESEEKREKNGENFICRLCLKHKEQRRVPVNESLRCIIKSCLPGILLDITEEPPAICMTCNSHLQLFIKFQKYCWEKQKRLLMFWSTQNDDSLKVNVNKFRGRATMSTSEFEEGRKKLYFLQNGAYVPFGSVVKQKFPDIVKASTCVPTLVHNPNGDGKLIPSVYCDNLPEFLVAIAPMKGNALGEKPADETSQLKKRQELFGKQVQEIVGKINNISKVMTGEKEQVVMKKKPGPKRREEGSSHDELEVEKQVENMVGMIRNSTKNITHEKELVARRQLGGKNSKKKINMETTATDVNEKRANENITIVDILQDSLEKNIEKFSVESNGTQNKNLHLMKVLSKTIAETTSNPIEIYDGDLISSEDETCDNQIYTENPDYILKTVPKLKEKSKVSVALTKNNEEEISTVEATESTDQPETLSEDANANDTMDMACTESFDDMGDSSEDDAEIPDLDLDLNTLETRSVDDLINSIPEITDSTDMPDYILVNKFGYDDLNTIKKQMVTTEQNQIQKKINEIQKIDERDQMIEKQIDEIIQKNETMTKIDYKDMKINSKNTQNYIMFDDKTPEETEVETPARKIRAPTYVEPSDGVLAKSYMVVDKTGKPNQCGTPKYQRVSKGPTCGTPLPSTLVEKNKKGLQFLTELQQKEKEHQMLQGAGTSTQNAAQTNTAQDDQSKLKLLLLQAKSKNDEVVRKFIAREKKKCKESFPPEEFAMHASKCFPLPWKDAVPKNYTKSNVPSMVKIRNKIKRKLDEAPTINQSKQAKTSQECPDVSDSPENQIFVDDVFNQDNTEMPFLITNICTVKEEDDSLNSPLEVCTVDEVHLKNDEEFPGPSTVKTIRLAEVDKIDCLDYTDQNEKNMNHFSEFLSNNDDYDSSSETSDGGFKNIDSEVVWRYLLDIFEGTSGKNLLTPYSEPTKTISNTFTKSIWDDITYLLKQKYKVQVDNYMQIEKLLHSKNRLLKRLIRTFREEIFDAEASFKTNKKNLLQFLDASDKRLFYLLKLEPRVVINEFMRSHEKKIKNLEIINT
ncbi:unnamed protein product [Brassicogethes aeneus]|uniref:ZAD domain-containing protein n=1 Tax=Brassicogethes aeneus TaxID=1431903 RepID=A0A9P0FBN4_BRAAE|nr:unnamed protein product [Brassicogethes aeneus]